MDVYMYDAALLCEDCGLKEREKLDADGLKPEHVEDENTYDSDEYPKGPYPDGGGEADSWQCCDKCNCYLGNGLTANGVIYQAEHTPGVELIKMSAEDIKSYGEDSCWYDKYEKTYLEPGFYFWYCQPGCLPDSDPRGPYSEYLAMCQDIVDENWPEEGENIPLR